MLFSRTELEGIVKKFVERRKEKDDAIAQLTSILDKLTENVKVMEQEIQTLEHAGGNQSEEIQMSGATMTDKAVTHNLISENIDEQSKFDQNSHLLNPFSTNPNGKEQVEDKR